MKLLERQPETPPAAPPQPPPDAPEELAREPGARACRSCGEILSPGQDWCLACGTASRRLRERPGARAGATIVGLMLLLVAGAVAASYAALRQDRPLPA